MKKTQKCAGTAPAVTHGETNGEVAVTFSGEAPSAPNNLQILEPNDIKYRNPHCTLGLVKGFLSAAEVVEITQSIKDAGLDEIKDRDRELSYRHKAYRCERHVRDTKPKMYNRLIDTVFSCDNQMWKSIGQGYELYPELEFIEYDVTKMQEEGTIDPHCDNGAKVTMIVLLSDPEDFEGGSNYFEDGTEDGKRVDLKLGDAIFFRGEQCEHWIAPVTSGRRAILQMELSTGHDTWDGLMVTYFFGCLAPMQTAAFTILVLWVSWKFIILLVLGITFLCWLFRTKRRFPPSIRCSPLKQGLVLAASFSWYAFLALIPVLADLREAWLAKRQEHSI